MSTTSVASARRLEVRQPQQVVDGLHGALRLGSRSGSTTRRDRRRNRSPRRARRPAPRSHRRASSVRGRCWSRSRYASRRSACARSTSWIVTTAAPSGSGSAVIASHDFGGPCNSTTRLDRAPARRARGRTRHARRRARRGASRAARRPSRCGTARHRSATATTMPISRCLIASDSSSEFVDGGSSRRPRRWVASTGRRRVAVEPPTTPMATPTTSAAAIARYIYSSVSMTPRGGIDGGSLSLSG